MDNNKDFFELLNKNNYSHDDLTTLLGLCQRDEALTQLYTRADQLRAQNMGDEVYLRGIIEFSNVCAKNCGYCGIRAANSSVVRYTMEDAEIIAAAHSIQAARCTTVVLQSGENSAFGDEHLGKIIAQIKKETDLAITVSVGVRSEVIYRFWRDCGMDRYLLRFETSDPELYSRIHPDSSLEERIHALRSLRSLGIQTGSGFLIGVPGETASLLADNILLCRELELDMIGIGPYMPHPDTPLRDEKNVWEEDKDIFFKALALLRLVNPFAHIPATTAFDTAFPGVGRNLALQRGANVFMPNSTPQQYRDKYLLYPDKPCVDETPGQCANCVQMRIKNLGRTIGDGPGHALRNHTS